MTEADTLLYQHLTAHGYCPQFGGPWAVLPLNWIGPDDMHLRIDNNPLIAQITALLTENARLRAGIAGLRQLEHTRLTYDNCPAAFGPAPCECGMGEHNVRIDALLQGGAP